MKKRFIIDVAYYFLIFLLIFLFIKYALTLVLPIFVGLSISLLLLPISHFLSKNLKISLKTASFLSIFAFYLALILFFYFLSLNIILDIKNFSNYAPHIYEDFSNGFSNYFSQNNHFSQVFFVIIERFSDVTSNFLSEISIFLAKLLSTFVRTLPNFLCNCILTVLSSVLFIVEYDFLHSLFTNCRFRAFRNIKNCLVDTFYTFLTSYAVIMSVTFIILSIGFYIARIENFLKFALIISFFDILPAIGIGFFLIPWIIFSFLTQNTVRAFTLITIYLICIIVRNILEPKLLSKKIGISPVLTIICMILGAQSLGIFGAVVAPFALIIAKNLYDLQYSSR